MSATKNAINRAMHAHSNLNIFEAVVAILEGGTIYGGDSASADRTARRIITLCKAEEQRQLKSMDAAVANLLSVVERGEKS